jgi:hypothetical protein
MTYQKVRNNVVPEHPSIYNLLLLMRVALIFASKGHTYLTQSEKARSYQSE